MQTMVALQATYGPHLIAQQMLLNNARHKRVLRYLYKVYDKNFSITRCRRVIEQVKLLVLSRFN